MCTSTNSTQLVKKEQVFFYRGDNHMLKKLGVALIALLLCASMLIACTPGAVIDRFFSFLGGSATDGDAMRYSTGGNVIYVSMGNAASAGNALPATFGNALASGGNAVASSGNAAQSGELPDFTVIDNQGGHAGAGVPSPTPRLAK